VPTVAVDPTQLERALVNLLENALRFSSPADRVELRVESRDGEVPQPERAVCRVLVSGVHAASLRAVRYAEALDLDDVGAVFFAFDAEEAARMRRDWRSAGVTLPLEVVEAPYRDLGDPLREYLRRITAEPGTIAAVVMPEIVVHGWARLLHNQRALYVKRLLLFEPHVVLASVPYQLP
jgi:hypothetical protein